MNTVPGTKKKYLISYLVFTAFVLAGFALYLLRIPARQLALISASPESSLTGSWDIGAAAANPTAYAASAAIRDTLYVAGGVDELGRVQSRMIIYDSVADSWTTGAPLPEPRAGAATASADGLLYVAGGYRDARGSLADTVFVYDPETNVWSELPRLPRPRAAAAAAVAHGTLYLFGGVGDKGAIDETLSYPLRQPDGTLPARGWETKQPLTRARSHLVAVTVSDSIIVIGGRAGESSKSNSNLVERYQPEENTWSRASDAPTPRSGMAAAAVGGIVYLFGGESPHAAISTVESYNPKKNRWASNGLLPTARHGLNAASIGTRIYVVAGGRYPGLSVSGMNEVFTPR